MKHVIKLIIVFLLIVTSCSGENIKQKEKQNMPQTKVVVNKEYDNQGNLIRYDSTYSYYYSNIENDSNARDSVMSQFKKQFNEKYLFSEEPFFNDLFFEDSLLKFDFYKKDYFSNRFNRNIDKMNKLFLEMDSIKNSFFMDQFLDQQELKE